MPTPLRLFTDWPFVVDGSLAKIAILFTERGFCFLLSSRCSIEIRGRYGQLATVLMIARYCWCGVYLQDLFLRRLRCCRHHFEFVVPFSSLFTRLDFSLFSRRLDFMPPMLLNKKSLAASFDAGFFRCQLAAPMPALDDDGKNSSSFCRSRATSEIFTAFCQIFAAPRRYSHAGIDIHRRSTALCRSPTRGAASYSIYDRCRLISSLSRCATIRRQESVLRARRGTSRRMRRCALISFSTLRCNDDALMVTRCAIDTLGGVRHNAARH